MSNFKKTDNVLVFPLLVHDRWNLLIEGDEPGVFSLAGTETADQYGGVEIHWSYPRKPLTLIIETPYTKRNCVFNVVFRNKCLNAMSKVYQILDGEEIEKNANTDRFEVRSDGNSQVVMKLVPKKEVAYSCLIEYDAEPAKSDDSLF